MSRQLVLKTMIMTDLATVTISEERLPPRTLTSMVFITPAKSCIRKMQKTHVPVISSSTSAEVYCRPIRFATGNHTSLGSRGCCGAGDVGGTRGCVSSALADGAAAGAPSGSFGMSTHSPSSV